MGQIDLSDMPQHHWSKKIIDDHKIPIGAVSKFVGRSYQHVCHILRGNCPATPKVEEKLKSLCDALERGDVKGGATSTTN